MKNQKIKALRERVRISLHQNEFLKSDFFRIRQRQQNELNQIIARYKIRQEQQEELFNRQNAAYQAKVSFLTNQIEIEKIIQTIVSKIEENDFLIIFF